MLAATTFGCAAETDDEPFEDTEEAVGYSRLGVDTNNATLDTGYAKSQGRDFVGRYLSFDGAHPALTAAEAQRLHAGGIAIFAIWEVSKYRPVEGGTVKKAHANGVADAKAAQQKLREVGAGGKPVYFTVDFEPNWQKQGDQILAYFDGIDSVLGVNQTGVYGTYVSVKNLFDHGKVHYGWQMTFGAKGKQIDPRAQLRQHDIYPAQNGWGVSGAGALDLDRAVKKDFGQW